MSKIPILVFATGTNDPNRGGSGLRNLVEKGDKLDLPYKIVGVCTPYLKGSAAAIAAKHRIEMFYIPHRPSAQLEGELMEMDGAKFAAASGYLWPLRLPVSQTINIHPGLLPRFGGHGMYGHHVHEATLAAFQRGEVDHSAVSMHFVTPYERRSDGIDNYDTGPLFAVVPVPIYSNDDAGILGKRVNVMEHKVQPALTALVATGCIKLRPDGTVWMEDPDWYEGKNLPYT